MNCTACGRQLPAGVIYCPNCGNPTPAYYNPAGTSPDNLTVASSSSNEPPPPPYTNYGSQPYGTPSPYSTPPPTPYDTPPAPYVSNNGTQLAPPPLPSQRRNNRTGLIIGIVVLLLVIIVGGVLAVSRLGSQGSSATATPTVAPAQATAAAQAHATATASAALTATAQAQATATASVIAANPNPYTPGSGKIALIDPLSDNSKGYAWDVGSNANADGTCAFSGGAFHVSTPKTNFFYTCSAQATDFSNFAFEVQMKIVRGDCGGMIFRANSNSGKLYFFEVCQDGTYLFSRYLDYTGNNVKDLAGGSSAAITSGLNQSNMIAVVAQGSTLSIYVNKQKIASASDSTFSHGQIGLFADDNIHPTEVAFNNVKVWTY